MATKPASIEDRYRLAQDVLAVGDVDVARSLLEELAAARPDEGPAHHLLGVIAYRAGKDGPAAEHFARAIRLEPKNGDYYSDLALVLSRMGEQDAAISGFRAAIHLKPDSYAAYNSLGAELRSKGQFAEAVACFGRALSLHSGYMRAHNNLGCVLREMGKPDLAIPHLEKAVALSPQTAEIHINLGSAYCDMDRLDEAMGSFRQALAIDPHCANSHNNLGALLHRMGRLDEAVRAYRDAIRLDPEERDAPNNMAMALLLQGDYEQGWRLYETRWRSTHFKRGVRHFAQPQWTGDLHPKRLLIHAEQGLGDTLQFCRYLPLIDPRHEVVFEVEAPLVDLMRQLPGVAAVVARGAPLPDFDAHCPLLSLPRVFETTLDTLPNQTPYLRADPAKVVRWAKRLEAVQGLKVGLVWAGGARPNQPELAPTNRRRSMNLASLAPLAQARGVSFISLQKGPPASEVHAPPPGMTLFDFTDDLHDFTDTAALVETLDLVIGVDTAVAHLAAAMGKPVWLLNRFDTCWRWLMNRDDSPWYPTLRLFRQPAPGDWDSVTADIAAALQHAADLSQDRATPMVRAA
jgi:Flp pilus assembly protein TadD